MSYSIVEIEAPSGAFIYEVLKIKSILQKIQLGLIMSIWLKKYLKILCCTTLMMTLCLVIISLFGNRLHDKLLIWGEELYHDEKLDIHYSFLRTEPQTPQCKRVKNIDVQVSKLLQQYKDDDLFEVFGAPKESDIRESVLKEQQLCIQQYHFYDQEISYLDENPSIRIFRNYETYFFKLYQWSSQHRFILFAGFILNLIFFIILTFKPRN